MKRTAKMITIAGIRLEMLPNSTLRLLGMGENIRECIRSRYAPVSTLCKIWLEIAQNLCISSNILIELNSPKAKVKAKFSKKSPSERLMN